MKTSSSRDLPESKIQGEAGTGFEKAGDLGEFECENCKYFKNGNECHESTMMKISKQPRHPNKSVVVGPEDCCEFVVRMGRKDEDGEESE